MILIGVEKENRLNKQKDDQGRIWHAMGDRVVVRDGIWWYGGRSSQSETDFMIEQKLAMHLETSKVFCARDDRGGLEIYVDGNEGVRRKAATFLKSTELDLKQDYEVFSTTIVRDHRHRARIDRVKSRVKAKREVIS